MSAVLDTLKNNEQDCVSEPLDTVTEQTVEPSQNDSWKTFLIKDHFSLTKKQLEEIDLTQESTVGQLADIMDQMNNGKEINRVGNKLIETLADQFVSFWSSAAYQATLDDTTTDDQIDLIANIRDALMAPPH